MNRVEAGGEIIWIASYPKSGSTWVRAVLQFLMRGGEPPDLDQLPDLPVHSRRSFDDLMGVASADLDAAELDRLRPLYHKRLGALARAPTFAKTHDNFLTPTDAAIMFPAAAGRKAVYIVRNPLDVVPSFAAYLGAVLTPQSPFWNRLTPAWKEAILLARRCPSIWAPGATMSRAGSINGRWRSFSFATRTYSAIRTANFAV